MTLYALILLCAGNCEKYRGTVQELYVATSQADCESKSLDEGYDIVTEIVVPPAGGTNCGDNISCAVYVTSHPVPVPPYVTYTVCQALGSEHIRNVEGK